MSKKVLSESSNDKTDKELEELLEKIERNIIGSITKGIEIVDNFSKEGNSSHNTSVVSVLPEESKTEEFTEAAGEASSIEEEGVVEKFQGAVRTAKSIEESRAIDDRYVPGDPSLDFETKRWEYLNPIILYKSNWMGSRPGGIRLEKGTYQIKYKITGSGAEESGLALFNENTRKVERVLVWLIGIEKSSSIINVGGTQHLTVYTPGILNITDAKGNFNPGSARAIYIITVFRLNLLPN